MARTIFRFASLMLPLLLPVSLVSTLAVADDSVAAIPVSPGDSQAGTLIGDPCPSFSWGAVDGAQRYELAIFDAQWDDSPGYADQQRQGIALRRIEIDAPALSWTPAGSECLDEGGSYLWFVRAETATGEEPWSAPRYFEIDYDADALTQTVRRELAAQLSQPEVWREVIQAALTTQGDLRLMPLASAALRPMATTDAPDRAARPARMGLANTPNTLATTFPNPSALKINSSNGVVFNNPASGGGIPAEGAGVRFMWYPGKGALRAGGVTSTEWDNANVGLYSTAIGLNTTASDDFSMALGAATAASGYASTALGFSTAASGSYSTAMGSNTEASGSYSTALGSYTIASGGISTALGFHTDAIDSYATALGYGTLASGFASTAIGSVTTASGYSSTAMGYSTTAKSGYETAIGRYNTDYTPTSTTDWNSADRLFVIGNGTGPTARSDA